jgi:hypothetical protein
MSSRTAVAGGKLALFLGVSFLACFFLAVSGGASASSDTEFFWSAGVVGLYWLLVVWWSKAHERSYRPMYSWVLTFTAVTVIGALRSCSWCSLHPGRAISTALSTLSPGWVLRFCCC